MTPNTSSHLQKRVPQGNTVESKGENVRSGTQGERMISGLNGLCHSEMGTSIVIAIISVEPVCKGAGLFENQGIT